MNTSNKINKKKLALIIMGNTVLLGGGACTITLSLSSCGCSPTPPIPVKKIYEIKTDGTDEYFNFQSKDSSDTNQLFGFKGDGDAKFHKQHYTNLIVPKGITSIAPYAFSDCISFRDADHPITVSFNLQSSFSVIGTSAFRECAGITAVDFSGSDEDTIVKSIGSDAFRGCALTNIEPGAGIVDITPKDWGPIHIFGKSNFIPNYVKDSRVGALYNDDCGCLAYGIFAPAGDASSICEYAFDGCAGITAVDFSNHNNVDFTSIGMSAFMGCALTNVKEGGGITRLTTTSWGNNFYAFGISNSYGTPDFENKSLSSQDCGCLAYGVFAPTSATPTAIGEGAFNGCAGITAVDFSKFLLPPRVVDVESIGSSAFWGCVGVRSYKFANNQVSDDTFTIGDEAFWGCAISGRVIASSNSILPKMINYSSGWMMSDFWITVAI